jgi:hypothetical protein
VAALAAIGVVLFLRQVKATEHEASPAPAAAD